MYRIGSCCLLLAAICSCSDDGVDRNVENRLTISQGLYGQTLSRDEESSEPIVYYQEELVVFTGPEPVNAASVIIARDTSDDHGFFEIELAIGEYFLCTIYRVCIDVSVGAGECVRFDFESGEQDVWSHVRTMLCP